MSWLLVVVAGLLEAGWSVGLKYTHGLTRPLPTLAVAVGLVASVGLLALAVRDLPIGTAYTLWVGIGALGATLLGAALFGEPLGPARLFFVALLVVALAGIKATA